jgi:hypothetical protein
MALTPVMDPSIKALGYDEKTGVLYVEFTSMSTYAYSNVPKEVFEDLMRSGNKNKYLHDNVKKRYTFSKVG